MRLAQILICLQIILGCSEEKDITIQTVQGREMVLPGEIWLSHEHILVDFIGADSIDTENYQFNAATKSMLPYLLELEKYQVRYFVDATPQYLGRDADFLLKLAEQTGLHIITNTGFYGAQKNKFVPTDFQKLSAEKMADLWIDEYKNGIDGTGVKPGFIKISVDSTDPLDTIHQKIVKASALTHLETGMTIASHTGEAIGLWPQLKILENMGVSPENFIWVHAQNEDDLSNYLIAAQMGCWISLDGIGWGWEEYIDKLLFAKQNKILHRILISHDAGWYDPQKNIQEIQPYTPIFEKLLPALNANGFTGSEISLILSVNPAEAYSIDY